MLRDILEFKIISIQPDASITEAAELMKKENVGDVLVLDNSQNNKPIGILTDRDICVKGLAEHVDPQNCRVKDVMSKSVKTVQEDAGLFDCIQLMSNESVRRIPVVDKQGKALGIISFGDILAILSKELFTLTQTTTPLEKQAKKAA